MEKITICSRCVMDTSDPNIVFDYNGVCNHCLSYDKLYIKIKEIRNKDSLDRTIKLIKASNNRSGYDCLIGLSGGVDSSYLAYYIVKELGLKPLAVHLDNGWDSELAVSNIEKIVKVLGIELITLVIDWEEFRDIQLSFIKASVPDLEIPTDHAIFESLWKTANKYNIKFIINGFNYQTESHHVLAWSQGHSDWKYIKSIQKRFGSQRIRTFPHGNYFSIFKNRFSKRFISLLNYIDYDKNVAKKVLETELGWRDYGGKHYESIFTRFYQGYYLPKKFGFDKRKMHLSSLICSGKISRQKALFELSKDTYPIDDQFQDMEYLLKKFNIVQEEFDKFLSLPQKSYFDYPSYYGKLLKNKNINSMKNLFNYIKLNYTSYD